MWSFIVTFNLVVSLVNAEFLLDKPEFLDPDELLSSEILNILEMKYVEVSIDFVAFIMVNEDLQVSDSVQNIRNNIMKRTKNYAKASYYNVAKVSGSKFLFENVEVIMFFFRIDSYVSTKVICV